LELGRLCLQNSFGTRDSTGIADADNKNILKNTCTSSFCYKSIDKNVQQSRYCTATPDRSTIWSLALIAGFAITHLGINAQAVFYLALFPDSQHVQIMAVPVSGL